MRGIVTKNKKYYKKVQASYQSGNAGGMYHYWDEYRAGARCAQIDTGKNLILQSVVMQIGGWTNEFHEGYVCNIIVDGSNDGITWYGIKSWGDRRGCNTTHTLDCSENTVPYRHYRFYAENGGWAYNDALSVASVNYRGYYITNEEVEETDDYDFVTFVETLKGLKKTNFRKYYYNATVPNCTNLGTMTVNDCVMSGFTTGTMAALPNTAKSLHNAEYMFKFTTGSDVTAEQNIVHIDSTFELHIQSGNLGMWHHYNQAFTNTTIAANTTYWVKMLLNDKDYNYAISTDGETFTTWASGTDSGTDISMQNALVVGNVTAGTRPFKGSIDFKACYAKSNGEFIWHGTKVGKGAEATADDYDIYEDVWRAYYKYGSEPNVTKYGNITIQDGIASGFTNSNYLILPTAFNPGENSWEVTIKVKPAVANMSGIVLGNTSSGYFRFGTDSGKIALWLSTVSDSWNIGTAFGTTIMSANKWYWLRCTYDKLKYDLYLSEDGESFTKEATINSLSRPAYQSQTILGAGNITASVAQHTQGEINLNESYIKVNGKTWWKGTGVTSEEIKDESFEPALLNRKYYKYSEITPGYRELTFVRGTSTSRLDTGVNPSSNTKIQAKFVYTNWSGDTLIGHNTGSESDGYRFFHDTASNTYFDFGSGDGGNRIKGSYISSTTSVYEIELGNRYVKDIPTNTNKISGSVVTFAQKSYTIKICDSTDYGIFLYIKIFDGDTLQRDLVPCERESDGAVGMYDKVNNVFYSTDWGAGNYIINNGTSADYDFYEDEYNYDYYRDIPAKYYAFKSYKQGEYYGN